MWFAISRLAMLLLLTYQHSITSFRKQTLRLQFKTLKSFSTAEKQVVYDNFNFEIKKNSTTSDARLAEITTPHGVIQTPAFVFCATKAAMKSLTPEQVRSEGSQIILSNTYHLMVGEYNYAIAEIIHCSLLIMQITPGSPLIERMGGLHEFTSWRGPMLTDSGGYQYALSAFTHSPHSLAH